MAQKRSLPPLSTFIAVPILYYAPKMPLSSHSNNNHVNENETFMISSFGRRRRSSNNTTDGNNNNNRDYPTSTTVDDNQDDDPYDELFQDEDPYNELFQDDDQSVNDHYDEDEIDHGLESNQIQVDEGDDHEALNLPTSNVVMNGLRGEDEKSNEEKEERINNSDNAENRYPHNNNSNAALNEPQDFSNFEEELGLNEAMLESLSEKLKALDNQIAIESNFVTECDAKIISLTKEQSQLRNTRETNVNLMKNVTLTMNKCMQRLRKKLDEKTVAVSILKDEEFDDPTADGETDGQISEDEESENDSATNDNELNASHQHSNPNLGMDESEKDDQLLATPIFKDSIPIQPIHQDTEYMKKMWSQNYPPNCPIFQHSEFLHEPLFPLHPPVSCPKKLDRMVYITQLENTLRRKEIMEKGDRDLLEKDYQEEIMGTCLDIFSSLQYDPFYINLLPKILKSNAYESDEDDEDTMMQNAAPNSNNQNVPSNDSDICPSIPKEDKSTIDPNTILCRYDLMGTCNDPSCPYQHLDNKPRVIKRVVKRKGVNKIMVATKESKPVQRSVDDYVVHLPGLTLPSLLSAHRNVSEQSSTHGLIENDEVTDEGEAIHDDSNHQGNLNADVGIVGEMQTSRINDDVKGEIDDQVNRDEIITSNTTTENSDEKIIVEIDLDSNPKKRKSSELEESDESTESNDDFIKLPPAFNNDTDDTSEDENQTVNSKEMEETGELEEMDDSSHQEDQSAYDYDCNSFEPMHLYEALNAFDFRITKSPDDDNNLNISYTRCESQINHNKKITNTLLLLSDIVDATRLCLYAGRIDICRAILRIGDLFLDDTNDDENVPSLPLSKSILADIRKFVDGSICGRGSTSLISKFYIQLGLSIVAYFVRCYRQAVLEQHDNMTNQVDNELMIKKYKRFASVAFGRSGVTTEDTKVDASFTAEASKFPYHLIPKQKMYVKFVSEDSTPKNRLGRVIECFLNGQNIARNITKTIYSSGRYRDPQIILDEFLFPLSNLIQNHVVSSKSSVAEDVIDNTLKGESTKSDSVGMPTQLCIFAIFGPSVMSCFSAIFIHMKKKFHALRHKKMESVSRLQGILVEIKRVMMTLIELFDQSAIAGENFEGRLLLTPYFALMSNLLAISGSYSKTQVLLENAIFSGDNSTRVWSIYAESLWSMLIQLRSCFQSHSEQNTIIDNKSTEFELVHQPFRYGLNIRMYLKGDTPLVQNAAFSNQRLKITTNKAVLNAREACVMLATRILYTDEQEHAITINLTSSTTKFGKFPLSVLLAGKSLQTLAARKLQLERLPFCFGSFLTGLKTLDVSKNRLQNLPNSFVGATELERIYLDDNNFELIPQVLSQLVNLTTFSAAKNKIEDIRALLSCKNLVTIDLRFNKIMHLPAEMALELKNLTTVAHGDLNKEVKCKNPEHDDIYNDRISNKPSALPPILHHEYRNNDPTPFSKSASSTGFASSISTGLKSFDGRNNDPTPFSKSASSTGFASSISTGLKSFDGFPLMQNINTQEVTRFGEVSGNKGKTQEGMKSKPRESLPLGVLRFRQQISRMNSKKESSNQSSIFDPKG